MMSMIAIIYITILIVLLLETSSGAYYEHEVVSSSISTTEQQQNEQNEPPPYSLGWYFDDPATQANTCETELNMIRSIMYETYYNISIQDSNMTTILTEKLANPIVVDIESKPVVSEGLLSASRLRRSRQLKVVQEPLKEEISLTCTPICSNQPNLWLIYDGCQKTCNNDHADMNDNVYDLTEVQKIMLQKYRERHNNNVKQGHVGEVTKILYGQGAVTASTFYTTVRELIPKFDECRNILLTMKYQRIPLILNPSQ